LANWFGSARGGRGVQLRPRARREGLGRDLAVVAATTLGVAIVVALVVRLIVPSRALPPALGGGATHGTASSYDVPVERVIARQPDGREVLGSFVLRLRADATPSQLRTVAERTPTPTPDENAPPRPIRTPAVPEGSAESLVRERVGAAMSSLTYQQTSGEEGKALLRQTVRDAVNASLPGAPVEEVYIREYLVQ
jgi:hypothetical protein